MMAKVKRILAFAVVLCLLLCLLPGCQERTVGVVYKLPENYAELTIDSGVVADNDNYYLEWDNEYKAVMMYSHTGEKVWGTTPFKMYDSGMTNRNASSPLIIEVVTTIKLQKIVARAFEDVIEKGTVTAKAIDNGVEVTYYFDQYQVSVPVQYVLRGDSVAVSIETNRIGEGSDYMLKSVSLAPYMCSVENIKIEIPDEDDELFGDEFEEDFLDDELFEEADPVPLVDAYVFVPAGNGALLSPALKDDKREYEGEVYGPDGSRYQPHDQYESESLKMPVFGVKDRDDALVGIIESGAEHGLIQATVGNSKARYSNAAATFYVRGFDIYADGYSYGAQDRERLSKLMVDSKMTVGFYPLTGEDANYIGMAKKYREYLLAHGMTKSDTAESAYALSIQGNVTTQSLAFGVPYQSAKSMTTFNEASGIIKDMISATNQKPAVQLMGYGESGLDIGKIAGGYDFASASGSKKDYAALTDYATKNGISLFTNFDLLYFSQGGNGFNAAFTVAKTATMHKAELHYLMLAQREYDKELDPYRILSRSKLETAMNKLNKKSEKLNVTGYNFSTLGSVAYSDYANPETEMKKNMGADVQALIASANKAGHKVSTSNANDYAAMVSDTIFDVEVEPRNTNAIDVYVPFYQIVFKGYVPMYSESLNYTTNYEDALLNALSSGVGLSYAVLKNYDPSFAASYQTNLYSSLYSANKDKIVDAVNKYADYYAAIKGATIENYEISGDVVVTTFSNGVVATANYAENTFTFVKGGTN